MRGYLRIARSLQLSILASSLVLAAAPSSFSQESSASHEAQVQMPYRAYVMTDDILVRSGPGQSYYPTDKLTRADVVEVYRHDPGGWLAIRPPEGSFEWVSANYLEPGDDGLGEITADRVAVRVGSLLSPSRDTIFVRLDRGELVELLGEERSPTTGQVQWYKIAPPSGSFRWISAKHVDRQPPNDGTRQASLSANPNIPDRLGRLAGLAERDILASSEPAPTTTDGWSGQGLSPPPGASEATNSNQYAGVAPRTLGDFRHEMETLENEFSMAAAQPPESWDFNTLRQRAEYLACSATTAIQRGRARQMIDKIDRFAGIKRDYQTVAMMRRENLAYSEMLSREGIGAGNPHVAMADAARYDGVGRLERIRGSENSNGPTHALFDESDRLRCFVSAAPGVDLRNYLGRKIAVSGQDNYLRDEGARHVRVTHIQPIDGRWLR